jgi:hypothetical protein
MMLLMIKEGGNLNSRKLHRKPCAQDFIALGLRLETAVSL